MKNLGKLLAKENSAYEESMDKDYDSVTGIVIKHMRNVSQRHFSAPDSKGKITRLDKPTSDSTTVNVDKVWVRVADPDGDYDISQQILADNIKPAVSQLVGCRVTVHISSFVYGKDHQRKGETNYGFDFIDVHVDSSFELKARMLNPNQVVNL